MGYIPGYQYDFFISYAHNDNIKTLGKEEGWIDRLITNLIEELIAPLGGKCTFWKDDRLLLNDELNSTILDALDKSAFIITFLSPNFLESFWCYKERNHFKMSIPSKYFSRVIAIEQFAIKPSDLPHEFDEDKIKARFFIHDSLKGVDIRLDVDNRKSDYFIKVRDLALNLQKILNKRIEENNREEERAPEKEGSSEYEKYVYLAEVTDNLDSKRLQVKEFLTSQSINVLPESYYSNDPIKFEDSAKKDMKKCSYFVQLLSEWPGKYIKEKPGSYIKIQLDIAKELNIPIFQWRDTNLDISSITDEFHKSIVDGPYVRAESIEAFKNFITKRILNPIKQPPENLWVFVNMEKTDQDLSKKVCEILDKKNISYYVSFQGNPEEVREDFERAIKGSKGIIIIYGESPEIWVRRQIDNIRKLFPGVQQQLNAIAIFQGPPKEKNPIGKPLPGLQLLDMSTGINESMLENELQLFIDKLN